MRSHEERVLDCERLCLAGMLPVIDGSSSAAAEQARIMEAGYPEDMVQGTWTRLALEVCGELKKLEADDPA